MKSYACSFHGKIHCFAALTLLMLVFFCFRAEADETRTGASKARMQCLKTGLRNFQADLGFFPKASGGIDDDPDAYFLDARSGLGFASSTNCLSVNNAAGYLMNGMDEAAFKKRWKGPYMDNEPEEFMTDCWGMPFIYIRHRKGLYLWAAGQDGRFDDFDKIITSTTYGDNDGEDDMVVMVNEFDNLVENKNIEALIKEANLKSKRNPSRTESGMNFFGSLFKLFGLD
ncbi:MAG: hypothetical protein ACOYXC_13710 [Candidatus Rifleibacteriota bacterium]